MVNAKPEQDVANLISFQQYGTSPQVRNEVRSYLDETFTIDGMSVENKWNAPTSVYQISPQSIPVCWGGERCEAQGVHSFP
jgi:hypothetical protein